MIGRTILSLMLLLWWLSAAAAQQHPPDTMEARLLACAAVPRTPGGGHKERLLPAPVGQTRRLPDEPAGRVQGRAAAPYPPMNICSNILSDPYLQKMADYFAALRPSPAAEAVDGGEQAVLARGRALATEGDEARGVPACGGCHGPKLTGMAIPGLVGSTRTISARNSGPFVTAHGPRRNRIACRPSRPA